MSLRRLKSAVAVHDVDARLTSEGLVMHRHDEDGGALEDLVIRADLLRDGSWLLHVGERQHRVFLAREGARFWVHAGGRTQRLEELIERRRGAEAQGTLLAPMTGTVQELVAQLGDLVEVGQAILVLSAMKMQVEVRAPIRGTLTELPHSPGDQVEGGERLAVIEPLPAEEDGPGPKT